MICHRGEGGERLEGPRHELDHCPDAHAECSTCPGQHCRRCRTRHVDSSSSSYPRTCVKCVGAIRDDLSAVETLTAYLPGQAAHGGSEGRLEAARPIPGGEATVLLAWGASTSTSAADESEGDPVPPVQLLAQWEDDFRHVAGQPAGRRPTMSSTTRYLHRALSWAAQHHDAIADFARDLAACRARLEAVLSAGDRDDTTAAPCFDCAGQLVRHVDVKAGRTDRYSCRKCGREYDVAAYWLAVRANAEREAG